MLKSKHATDFWGVSPHWMKWSVCCVGVAHQARGRGIGGRGVPAVWAWHRPGRPAPAGAKFLLCSNHIPGQKWIMKLWRLCTTRSRTWLSTEQEYGMATPATCQSLPVPTPHRLLVNQLSHLNVTKW